MLGFLLTNGEKCLQRQRLSVTLCVQKCLKAACRCCKQHCWAQGMKSVSSLQPGQEEKRVRHAGDREQLSLSYMMQGRIWVPTSLDISSNLKELLLVHCTLCITHAESDISWLCILKGLLLPLAQRKSSYLFYSS